MQWEDDLRAYLCALDTEKPVVYCGDLNVCLLYTSHVIEMVPYQIVTRHAVEELSLIHISL